MSTDITFIVPLKNGVRWVKESITSIIDNAYALKEFYSLKSEIIVVDNGSTDGSVDEITPFISADQISLYEEVPGYVSQVRNFGVERSSGQILVFIDADVILTQDWYIQFAEVSREILHKSIITGSQYAVDEKANWLTRSWFGHLSAQPHVNYINAGHLIVSRQTFDKVGQFNSELETGEDTEFAKRGKALGCTVVNNASLVAIHRGYPDNLKWFFNRERWHGKGNWQGKASKMTIYIVLFWCSILAALVTFSPIPLSVSLGLCGFMGVRKCGVTKTLPVGVLLSMVLLTARGASLIDVIYQQIKVQVR